MKSNQAATSTKEADGNTAASKRNAEQRDMFIDEYLQLSALREERRAELHELLNRFRGNQDGYGGRGRYNLMMEGGDVLIVITIRSVSSIIFLYI
jgi:hypothetical protein